MTPLHPAHPTHFSEQVSDRPTRMLPGGRVFRVVWLPGSDRLRGWCWCGTSQDADSPIDLWEWLIGHPGTHDAPVAPSGPGPRELVGAS